MKEAFYYMFKDNKILQKYITIFLIVLGVLYCIVFFPTEIDLLFFEFSFLLILLFVSLFGYWISCVKAIINQIRNIVLPYVNITNNLIIGLKYMMAALMLRLLFLAIEIFGEGLVSNMLQLDFIWSPLLYMISIFFNFMFIAFNWIFATTGNILSYTYISQALRLVLTNKKSYFVAAALELIVYLLLCILIHFVGIMAKFLDRNILLFALSFIIPYFMFVTAYINAKAIKFESK